MREQIQHPKLVILLMTPAYFDSPFCVMELGGTWALELRPLPIIVPPITFADVTNTIGQIQGWKITDNKGLETFRQTVLKTLDTPGRGNHNFERKRLRWEADLAAALERLAPSPKIPAVMYKELKDDNQALKVKLAERRQELLEARAQLQATKSMRPVALVVESEPLIAEDIASILEKQGYTVGIARTGAEAMVQANRLKPDLMTTEIPLADGSNGVDTVHEIQAIFDTIAVFVTAYPERLLSVKRPEPAFLVTKPYDPANLKAVLREAHGTLLGMREREARLAGQASND
jgi:CheY-like chemotaxis protein